MGVGRRSPHRLHVIDFSVLFTVCINRSSRSSATRGVRMGGGGEGMLLTSQSCLLYVLIEVRGGGGGGGE